MNLANISVEDLNWAIKIKEQIEALQSELDSLLGGSSGPVGRPKGKGKMSAAGRKAIAEAQKRRWAKVKSSKPGNDAKPAKKRMSAAGRAKIAAAAKARWARAKAAGKNRL